MADKKISQLTALSAANVASATDVLAIVDTSATETKKITAKDLIDGALNGGTANGVLYLNGSKVATSGSALVFDGTNLGIGTTSPAFGLSVQKDNGSGYVALFRKSASDPALTIQTTSGITQIQGLNSALSATNDIAFQLSGGNLGIGTASPVNKLSVLGKISASDSNFTASAYIHASPDSGANRDIGQFSVSGASNGLQIKWDHASSKMHVIINNIPTSSAGLPSGTLYNDGGTIKIA